MFRFVRSSFTVLFFLSFVFSFAQMDTEHWFAPMGSNYPAATANQAIYLSTGETTPFEVKIYSNNTQIGSETISKNNPKIFNIPRGYIITEDLADKMKVITKGLYLSGPKKYFATLRFSVPNHAEMVTSKGKAALGKTFFAGMPKVNSGNFNYMIGVLATEDNTVVTLSGYNRNGVASVKFVDGTFGDSKTITLNKGESCIFEANNDNPQNIQTDGLIGAKISSDKPVTVTSGSFSGQVAPSGIDIWMDQSIPTDKLGTEHIVLNGKGTIPSVMEQTLIIAPEDNTQVFINNGTTPYVTLNSGEFFFIKSDQYIQSPLNQDVYSLYLKSSKNIYVYQMLAGVNTAQEGATGGMNLIPHLDCFLPSTIDQLGDINRNNVYYPTKLNIITQTGATVKVNGVILNSRFGPYPVSGAANWEAFSVPTTSANPSIDGNITIESTKSVTAGIAAGNGNVGYGGYFSGFSSVPAISKSGDCFLGNRLEVDTIYDQYQWYLNGVAIPGANTYFINPEIYGAGDYTCIVTKNGCDTRLTTPYHFTTCPPIPTSTFTIGSCKILTISPAFTNSTQNIVPAKTKITAQGTSGVATVDSSTGIITYTPNSNLATDISDTFVYYIEGNGSPADAEYFRVNVNIKVLKVSDDTIPACPNPDGTGTFNLTLANISTDATNTIKYYSDSALLNEITNYTAYTSSSGKVYANITSPYGCSKIAVINLQIAQTPILNIGNYNSVLCDEKFTGSITVKFSDITPQIVTNYNPLFNVKYYLNPVSQQNGLSDFLPDNWSFSVDTVVYVRAEGAVGCSPVFGQINFKVGNRIPLLNNPVIENVCDSLLSGSVNVNLNSYLLSFTNDATVSATFYNSLSEAQNKLNPISTNQTLNTSKTFAIRLENSSQCPNVATLTLNMKSPKKSNDLKDEVICSNSTIALDAGPGFDYYKWSTGDEGINTNSIVAGIGNYWVDLRFNGCDYRQYVKVIAAELPQITQIEVTGNSATIYVTGGIPPYQYSLDGINFQPSNVFTNIPRGRHTVYVIDSQNCEMVEKEFLILNLINVITPNGDGINDVLDYSDLKMKKDVKMEIFDRFGNRVFSATNNYIWNGKLNGRILPTGTYWYILKWTEPEINLPVSYKGWILVKNRN